MDTPSKGMLVVKTLKQIMVTIKHNMDLQFKGMNVTGPQGMILGTLAHKGEMKISDLSHTLGLSNSTVSGFIDRLEKQGHVTRTRSSEDRRVVHVSVTPEFKNCAKQHFNNIGGTLETILNKASSEELDKIFEGLEILKKLISNYNDENSKNL